MPFGRVLIVLCVVLPLSLGLTVTVANGAQPQTGGCDGVIWPAVPCNHHGQCQYNASSGAYYGECRCVFPYVGSQCDQCAEGYMFARPSNSTSANWACSECPGGRNNVCWGHGTCYTADDGEVHCHCFPGWLQAQDCAIPELPPTFNPCDSAPCMNGGTCETISSEEYVCHCLPQYIGAQCQTRICVDSCVGYTSEHPENPPCNMHGTCEHYNATSHEYSGNCMCSPPYQGCECELCPPGYSYARPAGETSNIWDCAECPGGHENPCWGRGQCYTADDGEVHCRNCEPGWMESQDCSIPIPGYFG